MREAFLVLDHRTRPTMDVVRASGWRHKLIYTKGGEMRHHQAVLPKKHHKWRQSIVPRRSKLADAQKWNREERDSAALGDVLQCATSWRCPR